MTEMIAAEPALAERLLHRLADPASPAAELAAALAAVATGGGPIRLVGCGTSEHAAMAATLIVAEALRAARLPWECVVARQAFESWHDPGRASGRGGLLVAVSHEGGTWATNGALGAARDAGARTSIVTVGTGSPGAALADIVIATGEQDQSWCHTVGYLSPILAAVAVAAHLAGPGPERGAAGALVGAAAALGGRAEPVAAALTGVDRILVLGSGADRPAAHELALKLEEGTHLPATARDLETLLHGHLAAADSRTGVVLILTDRSGRPERLARARQVLAAAAALRMNRAAIIAAGVDAELDPGLTPAGRLVVPEAPGLRPAAAALLATAPALQLLTERLARARGTDPDTLRRTQRAYAEAGEAAEAAS